MLRRTTALPRSRSDSDILRLAEQGAVDPKPVGAFATAAPPSTSSVPAPPAAPVSSRVHAALGRVSDVWREHQRSPITMVHTGSMYARALLPGFVARPGPTAAVFATQVGFACLAPTVGQWSIDRLEAVLRDHVPQLEGYPSALAPVFVHAVRIGLCPEAELPGLVAALACHWITQRFTQKGTWVNRLAKHVAQPLASLVVKEAAFQGVFALTSRVGQTPLLSTPDTCNGSVRGCEKPLNHFAFAATHNSHAVPAPLARQPYGWFPLNQVGRFVSNQKRSIEQQFHDGIRGFLIDVRQDGDSLVSTHGPFDFGKFSHVLRQLAGALRQNPRSLIALQIEGESKVDSNLLARAFNASGLGEFMNPRSLQGNGCVDDSSGLAATPVGHLISQGVRCVWNCESSFWESKFDVRTVDGIACSPDALFLRDGTLGTLNMFTYPLERYAAVVNAYVRFKVDQCAAEAGRLPNLIAVNHYESSDVVRVALALNEQPA